MRCHGGVVEQALTVSQNPAAPLAILENGDRAIAATKTVAEIKEMRAQLDGVEEYLKKTGRYDPGIMQRLAELRVKAEQKLGNLAADRHISIREGEDVAHTITPGQPIKLTKSAP